jgi:methionyl aminopeptidase
MIKLKTIGEIDRIRESCSLLVEVLKHICSRIDIGISTYELDQEARKIISGLGARPAFLGYMNFPAALCTSVNEEVIHGIPRKAKLKDGDLLSIDCGLEYNQFYSDAAVTVPIGTIDETHRKLLQVTQESLMAGIEQAKKGKRINDISRAVYEYNKKHGYGVVRPYCGHGVGFDIHEEPQVPNYVGRGPNPRIKPGMVLAIEPMINLGTDDVYLLEDDWTVVTKDGSVSAHFEHTIAVFEDHTEILTPWEGVIS